MSVMLTAAVIDALVASGCTAEQLAAAMKASLVEHEGQKGRKRAQDAERQRRRRARVSHDVRVTECDIEDSPLSPSPLLPPHTPPITPHPHTPVDITPARKADDYPMPEGVDPQHWSDFLKNRRRRKTENSATAHKKLLDDLARLADDEWPPGRLIEYAAQRGWAGIYDPRKTRGAGQNANRTGRQNNYQADSFTAICRQVAGGDHGPDDGPPMRRIGSSSGDVAPF